MGCSGCSKKENLELPIPSPDQLYDNIYTFYEYVKKRDSNSMDQQSTFRYFSEIYGANYVNNPKQLRRAVVNMDKLYFWFKNNKDDFLKHIDLNNFIKLNDDGDRIIYEDEYLDFEITEVKEEPKKQEVVKPKKKRVYKKKPKK